MASLCDGGRLIMLHASYNSRCRSMEGTTEKAGGMSFEVILKPASSDAAPPHVAGSPTKDRPLSQGDIDRKLKEAEERRHVIYTVYMNCNLALIHSLNFEISLSLMLSVSEL